VAQRWDIYDALMSLRRERCQDRIACSPVMPNFLRYSMAFKQARRYATWRRVVLLAFFVTENAFKMRKRVYFGSTGLG